jgi:hypothetical protein
LHVGKSIGTAKDRAMSKAFKTSTSAQYQSFQKRLSQNDNLQSGVEGTQNDNLKSIAEQ